MFNFEHVKMKDFLIKLFHSKTNVLLRNNLRKKNYFLITTKNQIKTGFL